MGLGLFKSVVELGCGLCGELQLRVCCSTGLYRGGFLCLQGRQLLLSVLMAGGPQGHLLFKVGQALLNTLAAFDHKTNFSFQPPHLCAGLIKLALRLVDLVARRIVRLAYGFQVGFDMAQIGHAGFKLGTGFLNIFQQFASVGIGF